MSWSSTKQRVFARSLTESVYRALAALSVEVQLIKSLLHELGFTLKQSLLLYCDNISAKYML